NSEAALQRCANEGADGIEMDVRRCADGTLILFHDEHLQKSTHCEGVVEQKNADQLTECRYRKDGKKHRVISLRSFLASLSRGVWLTFDCKLGADALLNRQFAESLAALVAEFGIAHRDIIEAPVTGFLALMEQLTPVSLRYLYSER